MTDKLSFEEYLEETLSKEDVEWYNPEGNSSRAVVKRRRKGYWWAFKYECKEVWTDLIYFYTKSFEGFETPIAWFIGFVVYPFLLPFIPFTRTSSRYKEAIKDYEEYYQRYLETGEL